MTTNRAMLCCSFLAVCLLTSAPCSADSADELRFEIAALAGLARHAALLEHPAYLAIVLENNDLNPILSSKLVIRDHGRELEARNAVFRFVSRNGATYTYEAGVSIGFAEAKSRLTLPVIIDLSSLSSGIATVLVKPPLASLLPAEWGDRIQVKVRMAANAASQKKVLDYLDRLAKAAAPDAGLEALFEAVLLDSYNRSGVAGARGQDVGDALPLSEQWMLLLTLAIWLIVVPSALVVYRLRWRRLSAV